MKRPVLALAASFLCASGAAAAAETFNVQTVDSMGARVTEAVSDTGMSKVTLTNSLAARKVVSVLFSPKEKLADLTSGDLSPGLTTCVASYAYGPFGGAITGLSRLVAPSNRFVDIKDPKSLSAFDQAETALVQAKNGTRIADLDAVMSRVVKACTEAPGF